MEVLGGVAVSYERGTLVGLAQTQPWRGRIHAGGVGSTEGLRLRCWVESFGLEFMA